MRHQHIESAHSWITRLKGLGNQFGKDSACKQTFSRMKKNGELKQHFFMVHLGVVLFQERKSLLEFTSDALPPTHHPKDSREQAWLGKPEVPDHLPEN